MGKKTRSPSCFAGSKKRKEKGQLHCKRKNYSGKLSEDLQQSVKRAITALLDRKKGLKTGGLVGENMGGDLSKFQSKT